MPPAAESVPALVAALRRGGPGAIAALMRRVPVFADAIGGRGLFAVHQAWGVAHPGPQSLRDVTELADYLSRDTAVRLRLLHANRNEHQLLVMAALDGGMLDKFATRALLGLGGDRSGQARLDRAAAGLNDLLLTDSSAGWVALVPAIIDWIPRPGITFRSGSEGINRDVLAARLERMQLKAAGTRKFEIVDAIEAALRDTDTVNGILRRLDPASRDLLRTMVGQGVLPVSATGINYYRTHDVYGRRSETFAGPLHTLIQHGLAGVQEYEQQCWVWLDVELAARGGVLFDDWSESSPAPQKIGATGTIALPPTLGALDSVLDAFARTPIKALKTGGLGVQSVRAIAKSQKRTTAEVGLLAALVIELGLVGLVVLDERGRGRNYTVEYGWQPDEERLGPWRSIPAWARYARLVQQWLDSTQLPIEGQAIERYEPGQKHPLYSLGRRRFIELLTEFPTGHGLGLPALADHLAFGHSRWFDRDSLAQIVAEARVLGLVPAEGVVGLTATARQTLTDAPGLADALSESPTAFTVQADHTIIAPPGLDPDLDATLSRIATLESDAGARIYRITDTSLAGALDSGLDADAIAGFLHQYSTVEIAANVERTVRDAADRHGQLRIGAGVTWIACDDPIQLVRAVAVKAAKLTVISPTAAVSPLTEDKVLTALRAKGVMPTRADGAREPKARLRRSHDPKDLAPRAHLLSDLGDIDALAKRLADAPAPKLELVRERTPADLRALLIARRIANRRGGESAVDLGLVEDSDDDDFADWDDPFE